MNVNVMKSSGIALDVSYDEVNYSPEIGTLSVPIQIPLSVSVPLPVPPSVPLPVSVPLRVNALVHLNVPVSVPNDDGVVCLDSSVCREQKNSTRTSTVGTAQSVVSRSSRESLEMLAVLTKQQLRNRMSPVSSPHTNVRSDAYVTKNESYRGAEKMCTGIEWSELRDTSRMLKSKSPSKSVIRERDREGEGEGEGEDLHYNEHETDDVGNYSRVIYDLSPTKSPSLSPVKASLSGIAVSGREIQDGNLCEAKKPKRVDAVGTEKMQVP